MAILVSDTPVIIDLERGTLLDDLFRLPFEFAVPDLLFRRELAGPLGDRLVALGLRVEELTAIELTRATTVRRERKELSTPDTFAFAIAECRGWPLLTGDGGLRRLAIECRVEFHGVLWICDQFENGGVPLPRLHAGLTVLSSHPRCLLPRCANASIDTQNSLAPVLENEFRGGERSARGCQVASAISMAGQK